MSIVSGSQPDHGFWEFANCGRCQLPFISTFGATVPFWLTECGHIVCNSHLSKFLTPLFHEPASDAISKMRTRAVAFVKHPVYNWFLYNARFVHCPVAYPDVYPGRWMPQCLSGFNPFQCVWMQLPTLPSSNMKRWHHKFVTTEFGISTSECSSTDLSTTLESSRSTLRIRATLRFLLPIRLPTDRDNERLNNEKSQLREQLGAHSQYIGRGYGDPTSEQQDVVNSNGKRPRTEAHPYAYRQGLQATTSSPRSIITPLGPSRLTLPHGQPAPNLSFGNAEKINNSSSHTDPPRIGAGASQIQHRPAGGFIDKYAYVPSATPQFRPQQLTHAQAAPQAFKRTNPDPDQQQTRPQQPPQNQGHRNMPPPPTPTRFRAARAPVASNSLTNQFSHPNHPEQQQQRSLVKPAQSIRQRSGNPQTALASIHDTPNPNPGRTTGNRSPGANRFFPNVQQSVSLSSAAQAPSVGNGPQRFVPSGSRAPSRAQRPNFAGGGQRIPFVSHGQGPGGHI